MAENGSSLMYPRLTADLIRRNQEGQPDLQEERDGRTTTKTKEAEQLNKLLLATPPPPPRKRKRKRKKMERKNRHVHSHPTNKGIIIRPSYRIIINTR